MAQTKMKYGIDLGTTNSAICRIEGGNLVIKKTDTLKDTLPSCVSFTKKKIAKVGDSAYNDLRSDKSRATKKWTKDNENVFIEFKRNMGNTTAYISSNMDTSYSPEQLSAEVLKTLKSFIGGEDISSAVITVPAKFKVDQNAATKRAATLAGIEHCELLQEPIAAAMAYGLNASNKNARWLVFDFGGGTFDAALIKVEDGIINVKDTEGDNYLGGKNLDYAIVENLIIPHLKKKYELDKILGDETSRTILQDAMKFYAEQAKNQLSFNPKCDITSQLDEFGEDDNGDEIELDMIITAEELAQVLSPIFQKAVDITKELLKRNNMTGKDLDKLILVGGPTYSPILRQMLKEQITSHIDTDIDPMTAVAKGAALYAAGVDSDVSEKIADGQIVLSLSYEPSTVETKCCVAIQLSEDECTGSLPSKLFVELTRSDKGWASGKVEINTIGEVVECLLLEGKNNSFTITAYDERGTAVPCFPNEINIMQGIVVGSAVLPYNISIEVHDSKLDKNVVNSIKGLEKNQQLPATGTLNGLKTRAQIRPGMEADTLKIPIYQSEHNTDGTSALYNDHVFDVIITGDEVGTLIPLGSDVDITIHVDRSQMLKLEAFFPLTGETIEKDVKIEARSVVSVSDLERFKKQADKKLRTLKSTPSINENEISEAQKLLDEINARFDEEKNRADGRLPLQEALRRVFRNMEDVEKQHEWDALESELCKEFDRLEEANNDLGNKHNAEVNALRTQVDAAIRTKNVSTGRDTLEEVRKVFFDVTFIYQLIGFFDHTLRNFSRIQWKDSVRAQQLLQQGKELSSTNPSKSVLHPIACSVIDLMLHPFDEDGSPLLGLGGRR